MYKVLIFFICFNGSFVFGQKENDKNLELGVSFYQNGNLTDALYYLKKSLFKHESRSTHYYLGLVHLAQGSLDAAKNHFYLSVKHDSTRYYLAMIEKFQGDFNLAEKQFLKCNWKGSDLQALHCSILKNVETRDVRVKNLTALNTVYSEVSPCFFNDKILFSSNREKVLMKHKDVISSTGYYDFYESKKDQRSYSKPQKSSFGVNTHQHEIQPVFNTTFDTLYYCQSEKGKNEDGKVVLPKLYRVRKEGDNWDRPEEFLLNDTLAGFSHPHISSDGRFFFFASNMDGGYGGTDLYVSYKEDTSWSFPINLGDHVNTINDEISPYLVGDTLYFSSNGHPSFGGYDIFRAKISDGFFTLPENVGKPINSIYNDIYPVILSETDWLIVSDRVGGKGNEDIYSVKFSKKD